MSFETATIIFVIAASAMMAGSYMLSKALDRLGTQYRISLGLMGLITALAADSPEIASAATAIFKGEHAVGVGIVLGSNLFNIAALMGLGAVLARNLPIERGPLVFNTVTSLLVTAVAGLLVYMVLEPAWTMLIVTAIFTAYASILVVEPHQIASWEKSHLLARAIYRIDAFAHVGDAEQLTRKGRKSKDIETWPKRKLAVVILASLLTIVIGATFTVEMALIVWTDIGIPRAVIGCLIIAVLSSLPNAYTSAHLAREREGTAVVSETINSNTINVIVGLALPALILGFSPPKSISHLEIWWLLAMTLAALVMPLPDRRLARSGGAILIALYVIFIALRTFLS